MKILFLMSLILAACAPVATAPHQGEGRVAGVTLAAEPVAQGRVRLILQNGWEAAVGYNLCTSVLESRNGADWTAIRTDEICTMELRTLPAGQDATFEKSLPPGLAAGEYRYVTSVEIPAGSPQTRVATSAFRVP
jgi:hypothetical protein